MNSLILWHYYTKKSPEWANAAVLSYVLSSALSSVALAKVEALAETSFDRI